MKVAILLRGIPRYKPYVLGRKLLEKLLIKRFPECEFKIIAGIPILSEDINLKQDTHWKSVYVPNMINKDERNTIIKSYLPDYYICNSYDEAFRAANFYVQEKHTEISGITKISKTLEIFNDLCQHINYLHARKALINYVNDNKWYPDLIMNIRYDLINVFENDLYMKKWKSFIDSQNLLMFSRRPIQFEFQNEKIERYVFAENIEYYKNKVWMADWVFFETWSEEMFTMLADYNVQQDAYDLVMTDDFYNYTETSKQNSHFYWHVIFRNYIIKNIPTTINKEYSYNLIKENNEQLHEGLLNANSVAEMKPILKTISEIDGAIRSEKFERLPPHERILQIWDFYNKNLKEKL